MTVLNYKEVNQEIALGYLSRMKKVWRLTDGQWIDRALIPEIVETIEYTKASTGLSKSAMLEAMGIPSSKYYSWQKQVKSLGFSTKRPKRKSNARLLPKEVTAIVSMHERAPFIETDRLKSMLAREEGVYVSASSIRNTLKRKGKKVHEPKFEVYQSDNKVPDPPKKELQQWLQASLYLETPNGIPYVLRLNIDLFSQRAFIPCLYMIGSGYDSFEAITKEALASIHQNPKIYSSDDHMAGINEYALFLSTLGYRLSKVSPLKFTTNRSYGSLKGMKTREVAMDRAKQFHQDTQEDIKMLTELYNKSWPIKDFNYASPMEYSKGVQHVKELEIKNLQNMERAISNRYLTHRKVR